MIKEFTNKQQEVDHDLLVKLDVKVDILTRKVDGMSDGMSETLKEHERRLELIEVTIKKFDPTELTPRFFALEQRVHDFETTAKVYRILAGAIGGAIFFILSQLPSWIKLLTGI